MKFFFASETALLMSHHKFSINVTPQVFNWVEVRGLSWPLHYLNPFCLKPRFCSLTRVFGPRLFPSFMKPLPQKYAMGSENAAVQWFHMRCAYSTGRPL